jgi:N-acetylglucosamine-6-phosphate deacetylase
MGAAVIKCDLEIERQLPIWNMVARSGCGNLAGPYNLLWDMDLREGSMGFFDLQVNGYGGVDFNGDRLEPERVNEVCSRLASAGVDGILATIITDELPKMESRLGALVKLRAGDATVRRMVRGIHIEGPFLNPADGYRGAHPADAVLMADESAMRRLLDAGDGLVRLVTLAPERDAAQRVTRMLVENKIIVSAGHTDATIDELKAGMDAGLSMFTHLGNGCPAQLPRHDNIVNRVLSLRERLWITFIADGAHIPFFALRNYLDLVGMERAIVVTDAISAAGLGEGSYRLGRWELKIGEDGIARSPDGSHLVGSTATMEQSFRNLRERVGLSEADALKLVEENPRKVVECQ